MPRQNRIDAPGAVQHVVCRGIARRRIFNDSHDRNKFLDRFGRLLEETGITCYAWALLPNHCHLLIRTEKSTLATLMRRLLTGHAVYFNRRHRRVGHLFQNRYKSILCQEEPYLLELVRYIHLNPLRAGLVADLRSLGRYPYCGHGVLTGHNIRKWQDTQTVLKRFGRGSADARNEYLRFVAKGISQGPREDLVGGGLIRSVGGWAALKEMRKSNSYAKGDERILGDSEFVDDVLAASSERCDKGSLLRLQGIDMESVAEQAAALMQVTPEDVWRKGKRGSAMDARSLLCYWMNREMGYSMTWIARRFAVSVTTAGRWVNRGEEIARRCGYRFFDGLRKVKK